MARPKQESLPSAVKRLQQRVQKLRQSKESRFSITPVEFWDTAVSLAVNYGVGRIARTVGLDFGALRKKAAELTRNPTGTHYSFRVTPIQSGSGARFPYWEHPLRGSAHPPRGS